MTIDFIPIQLYSDIYYQVILFFTIITFLFLYSYKIRDYRNLSYTKIVGLFLLVFVLFYMGLRPIHGEFVDMTTYNQIFRNYAEGHPITNNSDLLFHLFTLWSSKFLTANQYFFLCASLYIFPLYLVSKKLFKQYWFYAFLMLVGSLSFWAYGVNGIRNGIATSFFLLAVSRKKHLWQIVWMVLAINFHATMVLPSLGFIATWFYNKTNAYYYFWFVSIILSLAFPGFWENLFAGLVEDDRASYLTTQADKSVFSRVGFRWDFLIYSASGVFAGWYYIYKKKYTDKIYIQLFNTYLFANAFWILVIRSNFSNRFAYLSWFMLALVIIYPWLKVYFVKIQERKLAWVILSYFLFTYLMSVIL